MFPAVACCVAAGPGRAKNLTPDQVLENIFSQFHKQRISTMVYDEVRTVSSKMRSSQGSLNGMMDLDAANAATFVTRYYYRAPDKHGYRMVSDPIPGFWPGSPNQENSLAMDERWLEKVRRSYKPVLAKDRVYKGKPCYTFLLAPKPGEAWTFNIMWIVDKKTFRILMVHNLVHKSSHTTVTSQGDITYGQVKGHTVPMEARWVTTMTDLPYKIEYHVRYENYVFNVPLHDSVFKAEPVPEPKK